MNMISVTRGWVLAALAMSITGCPDETTPADDGSSTGDSSSTGTPPDLDTTAGTTDEPETTSIDSSGGEESTSTGDEPAAEGVRFVVGERVITETGELTRLHLLRHAEGQVESLEPIATEVPMDALLGSVRVVDEGRTLTYCARNPGELARPCYVMDLRGATPGPAVSLAVDPVPDGASLDGLEWVAASESIVFSASLPDGSFTGYFVASAADGAAQAPQTIVASGPNEELASSFALDGDGSRVGYVRTPAKGAPEAWIAPVSPPDPLAAVQISAPVGPTDRVVSVRFVPGIDAALYVVDDDAPVSPLATEIWFVDLSGPTPAAPVRVDDPLDAPLLLRNPVGAPDGHALVYYLGAQGELTGDLMFVDLAAGVPQPRVRLSTLSDAAVEIKDYGWSSDARWIAYQAQHEAPDQSDLYLVEASGSIPGDPIRITEGLIEGGGVLGWWFGADAQWLYVVAQVDVEPPGLFRVDVSGDAPGPLQRISAADTWADEDLVFSHDGGHVLHSAFTGPPYVRQLAVANVSGAEPGRSTIINAPLAEGVDVTFGPRFSLDDSVVAYRESGPGSDDPKTLHLVDVASLEVVQAEVDATFVHAVVDSP